MEKEIPTNKHKVKYLLAEGFIIKDGDAYRWLTSEEHRQILTDIKKNGKIPEMS